MIRLIIFPAQTPGKFIARLEDGTKVCRSHQPIAEGARELLKRGFDPSLPITMRHHGKGFDSYLPHSLGVWAQITYSEGDKQGVRREKWRPRLDRGLPQRGGAL